MRSTVLSLPLQIVFPAQTLDLGRMHQVFYHWPNADDHEPVSNDERCRKYVQFILPLHLTCDHCGERACERKQCVCIFVEFWFLCSFLLHPSLDNRGLYNKTFYVRNLFCNTVTSWVFTVPRSIKQRW
jgi:hypothetical protein